MLQDLTIHKFQAILARGSKRGAAIAPSYMSPNAGGRGGGGGCRVSANEYSWAHGAQINFGDQTPYLTNQ